MKKIRRFYVCIVLFFLPTYIARILLFPVKTVKISKNVRIGFSVFWCDCIILGGVKIGHFNLFMVNTVKIGNGTKIRHLNIFKYDGIVSIGQKCWINHSNKISAKMVNSFPVFCMQDFSHITVSHIIDMSDSVTLKSGCWIAGTGTQIWTHSFYKSRLKADRSVKITKPVIVGRNCYIGSNSGIMPGVEISDGITVGSMTCVSKDLKVPGLYVSQPIRYVELDPDKKIEEMQNLNH